MSKYSRYYDPYDRQAYEEMLRHQYDDERRYQYEYEKIIRAEQMQMQMMAHPTLRKAVLKYAEEDARMYSTIVDDTLKDNDLEEETEDMVTKLEQDGRSVRKPSHKEDIAVQLQNLSIVRDGNKIVVPIDMPYETVIEAMKMKIAEDEKNIDLLFDFQLMVPEGALALFWSLNDIYGFVSGNPASNG